MNAAMARVAELDPEYVKRERRREIRFWASLVIAIFAIAGATWAVVVNSEQSDQITQVSACQAQPAGEACQTAKRRSSRAADLYTTCIPFWKAGYTCPKPGSAAAERHADQLQANSKEVQSLENGSRGGVTTGPGGSGEAPVLPGKGGGSGPVAPPKSTGPRHHSPPAPPNDGSGGGSAPAEQGTSPSSASPTSESPAGEQPAPETRRESALESAGATVGEVVNGAGHVVEAAGCELVAPLLCPRP